MANFNFNKVILGGRLTQDVELKKTQQGTSVCTFSIAVKRKGEKETTDFINCQAWRQTAEFIANYFKKGSSICIDGSIQNRSYEDKDKNKRTVTEIIVNEAFFVDSKADNQSSIPPAFQAPKFEEVNADDDIPF